MLILRILLVRLCEKCNILILSEKVSKISLPKQHNARTLSVDDTSSTKVNNFRSGVQLFDQN